MKRIKIVFEHDQEPDFSWLEQDQYDPSKPGYDPIYPTETDMRAKTNAYDGDWYRDPDNHVALCMLVYVMSDDDQDWTLVDSLGNIDFLRDAESDWITGTFYRVDDIPKSCTYLRELVTDALREHASV